MKLASFGKGDKSRYNHQKQLLRRDADSGGKMVANRREEKPQQYAPYAESSRRNGSFDEGRNREKSFAQVVKGKETISKQVEEKRQIIKIQPTGMEWLLRSAIAKIQMDVLVQKLQMANICDVQIRNMGGRSILLTFTSKDARDGAIKENWLKSWFYDVKQWEGEAASMERFAWLNCFGMPLNGWCSNLFRRIGEHWGSFIMTDDDTSSHASFDKGRVLIVTE